MHTVASFLRSVAMTPSRYRIVGTAGHIDHGKSALVQALTGVDPDRLQEEKERGITIDLGFADATFGDLTVAFVDVPGHERFVKNMLAGVGGIDAVLLVVAADESVMPQTREHLAICSLLEIGTGVVAISKCDLVDEEIVDLVELEVSELLSGTPLADTPIVRTSASTGAGLEELRDALVRRLAGVPPPPTAGLLRLPVDRVFTIKGFGTVVTGTLLSGVVETGDRLEVLPGGLSATVRGIQVHGEDAESARAGQRTALNLQGVQVEDLERGVVLARPGTLSATQLVDARVTVLPGFEIEHDQRVRFHQGAAEVLARVSVLQGDRIAGDDTGLVQLRLESPYALSPGDRFVLRRYSPLITVGGGVVIDVPPGRHRRRERAVERLRRLEDAAPPERVAVHVRHAGTAGYDLADLAVRMGIPVAAAREAAAAAAATGTVEVHGHRAFDGAALEELRGRIEQRVRGYHERYPLRPAMPKEEIRSALPGRPSQAALEAALGPLVAADRLRPEADGFAVADHVPRLPGQTAVTRAAILARYEQAGLAAPTPEAVLREVRAESADGREVLHYLIRQGELVRVKDDLIVHADAVEKLVDGLQRRFDRGEQFSVADFRDWAGVTRKHAIPLLEHLDSLRITRRVGDLRERI